MWKTSMGQTPIGEERSLMREISPGVWRVEGVESCIDTESSVDCVSVGDDDDDDDNDGGTLRVVKIDEIDLWR